MSATADPQTDAAPSRLAFGDFVVDLRRGELTRDGEVVALRRKACELLVALASRPGELRSRDEPLAAVRPGVVVGEDSLAQCVHELPAALGAAGAAFVRTVPQRGYRFDAEVHAAAPGAPAAAEAAGAAASTPPDAPAAVPGRSATSRRRTWAVAGRERLFATLGMP